MWCVHPSLLCSLNSQSKFAALYRWIFYQGDYTRQMEAVQRGGHGLHAQRLEANYPQNIPLFQQHEIKHVSYQSEAYPFLTSTELVPAFGLSAALHIPWMMRGQILSFLDALNTYHPAAVSAGISRVTLAASYEPARKVGRDSGVIVDDATGTTCHRPFEEPHAFILCPPGFVKDSPKAIDISCERRGLPCPPGLVCVCRPCIPVLAVNVFPWEVVLGLCAALFATGLFLSLGWRATISAMDSDGPESPGEPKGRAAWPAAAASPQSPCRDSPCASTDSEAELGAEPRLNGIHAVAREQRPETDGLQPLGAEQADWQ